MKFPIIEVPSDLEILSPVEDPSDVPEEVEKEKAVVLEEQQGTKSKFWFLHKEKNNYYLYKKARLNSGEDWSEKIAAELCRLLKLPHANYDLAIYKGDYGTVSPSFVPGDGSLIWGNEILSQSESVLNYPENIKDLSQHTINNIFQAVGDASVNLPLDWIPPNKNLKTAADIFVGYLLLDAWIGNTDRHHENWAFIRTPLGIYLAPTYDHAACLGRNEPDHKRKQRLLTTDAGFSVQAYAEKCTSLLYANPTDKKPLKTFDAFVQAAQLYPNAAYIWLNLLEQVRNEDTLLLLQQIPNERISAIAIEFAQKILEINRNKLLEVRKEL